jgi:hypothetical protein
MVKIVKKGTPRPMGPSGCDIFVDDPVSKPKK